MSQTSDSKNQNIFKRILSAVHRKLTKVYSLFPNFKVMVILSSVLLMLCLADNMQIKEKHDERLVMFYPVIFLIGIQILRLFLDIMSLFKTKVLTNITTMSNNNKLLKTSLNAAKFLGGSIFGILITAPVGLGYTIIYTASSLFRMSAYGFIFYLILFSLLDLYFSRLQAESILGITDLHKDNSNIHAEFEISKLKFPLIITEILHRFSKGITLLAFLSFLFIRLLRLPREQICVIGSIILGLRLNGYNFQELFEKINEEINGKINEEITGKITGDK